MKVENIDPQVLQRLIAALQASGMGGPPGSMANVATTPPGPPPPSGMPPNAMAMAPKPPGFGPGMPPGYPGAQVPQQDPRNFGMPGGMPGMLAPRI